MIKWLNFSRRTLITEAVLSCLGFMVFSFFIHQPAPYVIIAFVGLIFPAYIIGRQLHSIVDIPRIFGISFSRKIIPYLFIGLQLGLIYSLVYRKLLDMSLFPKSLTWFALTAALIGALEELIFRGFIQSHFKRIGTIFSVVFASFSHTAYKCCLFLAPIIEHEINILFLFLGTFVGGLLFGILKELSRSVVPAAVAHLFFDILIYGECTQAPWWVW